MLYRRGVIAAVKAFGPRYFSTTDPRARLDVLRGLADAISAIYGRPSPRVDIQTTNDRRLGHCSSEGIFFNGKLSFATFLHELYHWLTFGHSVSTSEDIARQWSVSLFIRALPERCQRFNIQFGMVKLPSRSQQPGRRLRRILPTTQAPVAVPEASEAVEAVPQPA